MKKKLLLVCFIVNSFVLHAQLDSLEKKPLSYIAISQEYSHFNKDFSPWHTTSIEGKYSRKSWTFLTRGNLSNRFDKWGVQLEQEAYKTLKSKDYFFIHMSGSPSEIFYKYRFAGEYFNAFSKVWEHSIGMQYMQFQDSISLTIATASLSKYTGKFLTILRANVGYQNNASLNTISGVLQQRYYHSDDEFTALYIGYGYDPSVELFNNARNAQSENTTFTIGAKTLYRLSQKWLLQGLAEYQRFNLGLTAREQYTYNLKLLYTW